jgi:hypothetical protein
MAPAREEYAASVYRHWYDEKKVLWWWPCGLAPGGSQYFQIQDGKQVGQAVMHQAAEVQVTGRGLHSSTSQLNLSRV